MKTLIIAFSILLSAESLPQSSFQNFLNRVNSISDSLSKAVVIDSFINFARTRGIPFIEDSTANFIYRGQAENWRPPTKEAEYRPNSGKHTERN